MRDPRYETTRQPTGYERLGRFAANRADGAVTETLSDGSHLITLPDPPHWRNGPARQTRSASQSRARAGLELRRRQLDLLRLTGS